MSSHFRTRGYEPTIEQRGAAQLLESAATYLEPEQKKLAANPHDTLAASAVEALYLLHYRSAELLQGDSNG